MRPIYQVSQYSAESTVKLRYFVKSHFIFNLFIVLVHGCVGMMIKKCCYRGGGAFSSGKADQFLSFGKAIALQKWKSQKSYFLVDSPLRGWGGRG